MKIFKSIEHLRDEFVNKRSFKLSSVKEGIVVNNQQFSYACDYTPSLVESIFDGEKPGMLYVDKNDNTLVFAWALNEHNCFVPYNVFVTSGLITEETTQINDDLILADKVPVKFIDFPSATDVVAKVDTGAEVTSLHALDVEVHRRPNKESTVSFTAPHLGSQNRITMPMITQSPVKLSSGHTTNRPVIKMSIEVQGKVLQDLLVNLNDRSEMDDPMLLGQNALEAGRFIVDPSKIKDRKERTLATEGIRFFEELRNQNHSPKKDVDAQELLEALKTIENVSFNDIIKAIRTDVIKRL